MKNSNLVPWLLAGVGLTGLAYFATRPNAIATAPLPKRASPPAPVPVLTPGPAAPVTTPAPVGIPAPRAPVTTPAPVSTAGLTPAVSATIAALLDTRVQADPALLNAYAKIAAGPDGLQNTAVVSRLNAKAYITALANSHRAPVPAPAPAPAPATHRRGGMPV